MEVVIRDATQGDVAAICELINALIPTDTVAWTETLETVEGRTEWFARQEQAGFPVLVATEGANTDAVPDADADADGGGGRDDAGRVIGFAAYGDFRDSHKWPGYRFTVEHSVHVAGAQWGSGIGRRLMEALIGRARQAGVHAMIAAIDGSNDGSIRFHENLGFTEVGRLPEVGFKFERWLDLVLLELRL